MPTAIYYYLLGGRAARLRRDAAASRRRMDRSRDVVGPQRPPGHGRAQAGRACAHRRRGGCGRGQPLAVGRLPLRRVACVRAGKRAGAFGSARWCIGRRLLLAAGLLLTIGSVQAQCSSCTAREFSSVIKHPLSPANQAATGRKLGWVEPPTWFPASLGRSSRPLQMSAVQPERLGDDDPVTLIQNQVNNRPANPNLALALTLT